MTFSSQSVPNSSGDDHFGDGNDDGMQALTLTAEWSNVLSVTDSSLQMPMGPLDPELAAFDDLFNSGNPLTFTSKTYCGRSIQPSSPGATVNTESLSRKSSQITISDTITPPLPAMSVDLSKSHRNVKQQRCNTSFVSSPDGNNTPVAAKEENWHVTTRERNRIAASKCRQKKRLEEKDMEEARRSLELQNAILQDTAAHLREEVLFLKNEILRHGACDFPPIQNYVLAAASQIHGGYIPDS